MEFLEAYAQEHDCSLYDALRKTLDQEIFRGTKAKSFVELIEEFSEGYEETQISDLLSGLLNRSGYEEMLRTEGSQERLDNLAELKQSVYDYEITCGEEAALRHYLAHIALLTNTDVEDTSDKVRLMTVHAAKGLEFPYVFLCGMDEGIFPSGKIRDLDGMEEERRLAFVAMTRAEKRLFLSGGEGRNFDGSPRYPSRFVLDIEDGLLDYAQPLSESLIAGAKNYIFHKEQAMPENIRSSMLAEGTRIRHEYLGTGTILKADPDKAAYEIRFDAVETPRTISFRVRLEILS